MTKSDALPDRDAAESSPPEPHYLLGHTDDELQRLDLQGELYRDITRRAFVEAGIGPGMRVLDIGCGSGDVSRTVGDIVGPSGNVLGIDRGDAALEAARASARARDTGWLTFERAEIDTFDRAGEFDALVGRFVLMHQAEPVEVLRAAARSVKEGGVVVMIESYMDLLRTGSHSEPFSPLYDRIVRFKCDVVRGAGADLHAGGRLRSTFVRAGLVQPVCRLEARVEGGPDSLYWKYVAQSVRSMLPEAQRLGIADFTADDAATLSDELRDDVVGRGGSVIVWPVVAAHARVGQGMPPAGV